MNFKSDDKQKFVATVYEYTEGASSHYVGTRFRTVYHPDNEQEPTALRRRNLKIVKHCSTNEEALQLCEQTEQANYRAFFTQMLHQMSGIDSGNPS